MKTMLKTVLTRSIAIFVAAALFGASEARSLHGGIAGAARFSPTSYMPVGDSISVGAGSTDPFVLGFTSLYSTALGTSYIFHGAAGGEQSCDNGGGFATFSAASGSLTTPGLTASTLYTVELGANDANVKGAGAYEINYNLCMQAIITWLSTPITSKVLAQAATKSGTWTDDTVPDVAYGRSSTASGATLTFSITTQGNPLYIWYRVIDGSSGTFTYNIDGAGAVSVNCFTTTAINTQNGSTSAWFLKRITGVSAGAHTVVLTVTSSGQTVDIWAIGSPPSAVYSDKMRTLVSNVLRHLNDGFAADNLAYNSDIIADVALLQGDNLPISLVDARSAVNTTTDMFDNLHPNDTGHAKMKNAFLAVFP